VKDTSLGVYVWENFTVEDAFNKIRVEKLEQRCNGNKSKLKRTEGSGSVVFSLAYVPVVIDVTQESSRVPTKPAAVAKDTTSLIRTGGMG
jgi:hypothetical protein